MTNYTLKVTVLCENSVAGPFGLIGEHGWSAYIEIRGHKILFDTGQGQGIRNNSLILQKKLSSIDAVVLSHGHYDHTGGLPQVLTARGEVPVIAHRDIFVRRYWSKDNESRFIGIRFSRAYLESIGARFKFVDKFTEILPGVFVTGEVPRETDFEPPDPNMQIEVPGKAGELRQDPLLDDLSMVVDTPSGLVVILGCAHAGIVNILRHIKRNLPDKEIHAVMGGTHLGFATREQFDRTLEALDEFQIDLLGASHCTGLKNSAELQCRLGDRFFHAAVGTVLKV